MSSRPDPDAVAIRPAATVLLVRDGSAGLEVFAQTRATSMAFAAGVTAFPGGGVDPTDSDLPPFTGRSAADWDRLLDRPDGAHLVVAGVRELFEEVGVLLSDPALLPGPDRWAQHRVDVTAHRIGIAEVLRSYQAALPGELLKPWSRWITPVGPPRRYDTHFLLVPIPDGQEAVLDTTEATHGAWARPAELLAEAADGGRQLMLPTQITLSELADHPTVASTLAAVRTMDPVEPEIVPSPPGSADPTRVRVGDRVLPLLARTSRRPS